MQFQTTLVFRPTFAANSPDLALLRSKINFFSDLKSQSKSTRLLGQCFSPGEIIKHCWNEHRFGTHGVPPPTHMHGICQFSMLVATFRRFLKILFPSMVTLKIQYSNGAELTAVFAF